MMDPELSITLPGLPPSLNKILRLPRHQRISLTAQWRNDTAWECKAKWGRPPLPYAIVSIRFIRRGGQLRDEDNLCATWIVNGLRLGGVLVDDDPAHVHVVRSQQRGERTQVVVDVFSAIREENRL